MTEQDLAELSRREAPMACARELNRPLGWWMLAGVGGLLGVTTVIYWVFPVWKVRRGGLVPMESEDAPEVMRTVEGLCSQAGQHPAPLIVWQPLVAVPAALAFGRIGRRYVALTGGLVMQHYTDPAAFRAILLHELAHLRNGDVDKAYFAIAAWHSFLLTAVTPYALSLVLRWQWDWMWVVGVVWHVAALATFVYLMRNAILRARETYADLRASVWEGATGRLDHVLESLPTPRASVWRAVWRVHPDPAERRRALRETARLFEVGFGDALGAGIAAGIAVSGVTMLFSYLSGHSLGAHWAASLVFAPLATGVVGGGAWRAAFAALVHREALPGVSRLGLGLGLGVVIGLAISFETMLGFLGFLETDDPAHVLTALAAQLVWNAVLVISLVLFLRWIVKGAAAWLPLASSRRAVRVMCTVGLLSAGGLLAAWLGLLFVIREVLTSLVGVGAVDPATFAILGVSIGGLGALALALQPPTLLALVTLWAFPLAATTWPRQIRSTETSGWAFLDAPPPGPLISRPPVAQHHLALALRAGMQAGIAFNGLVLLYQVWWSTHIQGTSLANDESKVLFVTAQISRSILLQAVVAAIVASKPRGSGWLHGLLSAFVAACIMAGGILGWNVAFGGSIEPGFAWSIFGLVVGIGAVAAAPVALVAAALSRWVAGRTKAASRSPAGSGSAGGPIAWRGWRWALPGCGVLFALWAVWLLAVPASVQTRPDAQAALYQGQVAQTIVWQIVAAATAALQGGWRGVRGGAAAALIAGGILSCAMVVVPAFLTPNAPDAAMSFALQLAISGGVLWPAVVGTLLALPVATCVAMAGSAWTALRRSRGARPSDGPATATY
jgi:hypothetical protein